MPHILPHCAALAAALSKILVGAVNRDRSAIERAARGPCPEVRRAALAAADQISGIHDTAGL